MTNTDPLISIGIPTYNRAAGKLRHVVQRALDQTYKNVEVIVSDNCSSDNTPQLMESFNDPRLRYYRQETNIGPNNNFNYCLQQAKGQYFLLFHDDDMIDEDFVESCVAAIPADEQVGVIVTGVRLIDEDDNIVAVYENKAEAQDPAQFVLEWYADKMALYLCNTLYNTSVLRQHGGFHSKAHMFDDLVATFNLATQHGRTNVREAKASFRRHTGNRGSSVPIDAWMQDSLYLLDLIDTLIPQQRDVLRPVGARYLSKKMYRHAVRDLPFWPRLLAFLRIYRAFDFAYNPLYFLFVEKLRKLQVWQ